MNIRVPVEMAESDDHGLGRPDPQPLVLLRDVTKVYPGASGGVRALDGVSLLAWPGELLGVIGPSGAGKSTLINMVSGVDRLSSGEVRVANTDVQALGESDRALWRGRNVGVVYQSFELLPMLSLLDNVMLPMDLCGLYHRRRSPARARTLLTQVGLEEHMRKPPTRVSGGQQQRVAIARALANDPPLILADEPTGNLDSVTAEAIVELFHDLAVREGKTVIVVTHDEALAAHFTRTIRILDGRLGPVTGSLAGEAEMP
jgi:putative ABC transport system ATP-binding protein